MKKIDITLFCALCAILMSGICGCNSTPVRTAERAMVPVDQVQETVTQRRAEAFRKALAPLKTRGAGFTFSAYRSSTPRHTEIIELVKKLGFDRIYCGISSETELSEELKQFVITASAAGIPVELSVKQRDFKQRFHRGFLPRLLLPQYRQLPELAGDIAVFNEELPDGAKLAGVSVAFEPHSFTHANGASEIPGLNFLWDNSTFGKGLDNDKLVDHSITQLREMKKKLGTLPLTVELPDFYPVWKQQGKLTRGGIEDLADIGKVMIRCTANVPSQLVKQWTAAVKKERNMTAVIPVSDHTSVRSGALRRRDWNDLVRALGYFVNSSRKTNCSGVVIRPLSELGYMLLEQD